MTPLSPREREVADLLVRGLSDKCIGYRLGITRRTVSDHVSAILGKLGASNRTMAAVILSRQEVSK